MGKGAKQAAKKAGKIGDEVGGSQQRLSGSAGVLQVKRKRKEIKAPPAEPLEEVDEQSGDEEECPLGELPRRMFSLKKFPKEGRINTYSRIERLCDIVEVLDGTPELEWIKDSPFGPLFGLSTRHCEFSGRLVHGMLCRSLITAKKHEMWFVFGGKPIRFSLREFAMITGLNCNPLPSEEEIKRLQSPEEGDDWYWDYLIGKPKTMTIEGIIRMLKADKKMDPQDRMDPDRRMRLCLIIIVEGILCVRSSAVNATRKTVEMVKDLDSFCDYPWGRESFELTLSMVNVGEKVRSLESLAGKLYQSHISNHGFTLAYQLLAVYTVPLLEKIIPVKDFDSYFNDPLFTGLAKARPFHNSNVLKAERNPNLIVESLLSTGHDPDEWDLSWDDEVDDPRVERIIQGLESNYNFKPSDWKVQRIIPIHRHPKARGKSKFSGEMFDGMAGGDSSKYSADRLVEEGDRLMDNYLTRKHDFEVKEMEGLRESYRQLIIKALTMNEQCREEAREDQFVEEEVNLRTPPRKGMVASDAETLSSGEPDSEPQLIRKNKGKAKKGKSKGKRVQVDVPEESSDSDKKQKKKRQKAAIESPVSMPEPDPVGTSIMNIVQAVGEDSGKGVGSVDVAEAEAVEKSAISTSKGDLNDEQVLLTEQPKNQDEQQDKLGDWTDHMMLDPQGPAVVSTDVMVESVGVEPRISQEDCEVPPVETHANTELETLSEVRVYGDDSQVSPVVPETNEQPLIDSHVSPVVPETNEQPLIESHVSPVVPETNEQPLIDSHVSPVVPETNEQPLIESHVSPVVPETNEQPLIDSHVSPVVPETNEQPLIDSHVSPVMPETIEDGTAAMVEKSVQRKSSSDIDSLTNANDGVAGQTDSHFGATEKFAEDQVDRNYCSGYEDDDVVEKPKEVSKDQQSVPVHLGPVLALRSTRTRNAPQRLGHTPEEKLKAPEEEEEVYDPRRPVSDAKKKLFFKALENRKIKELKVLGHDVKRTFFRELYKPKQHLTTAHMEAMLASVWAKRGAEMLSNKVAVLDSWFCQYLVQEHGRYCKLKNPPIPFNWHPAITNCVAGNIDNRDGQLRWMVDVDNLYAPMNWGSNHWVAININLVSGTVTILDCNQDLTPETKVPRLMKPVVDVLPWILRDLVDEALEPADSFDYIRAVGVAQNERAGDCGPLTVKFIELDAQGHSVDGISEDAVDDLRLRYAVEVYEGNGNPL